MQLLALGNIARSRGCEMEPAYDAERTNLSYGGPTIMTPEPQPTPAGPPLAEEARYAARTTMPLSQRRSGAERCGAQSLSHVVSFSGGACSFWAAARVVERYGPENVTLLFADTRMEDEDLYRFMRDAVQYLGVPLTTIADGRNPWEVFSDEGMLGNSRADLCSRVLKRDLIAKWERANLMEMTSILYVGIDWTEEHRLHRLRLRKPGWRIEAPMTEAPLWDKCRMMNELRKIGIEPPRLYKLGFPHNNCGGFCIKAGQAHFANLLKVMPERYAMHEASEEAMRGRLGDVSIMKDRRGGRNERLTMRQLRARIEAGESFDREDWGGCGCALDSDSDGLRGGAERVGSQASGDSTAQPHNSVISNTSAALSSKP